MNSPVRQPRLSLFSPEIQELKAAFLAIDTNRRNLSKEYKTKKILVVGLSNTGKSSLTLKFLYGFPDVFNHGSEENHYTSIKYKNEDLLLHIVDIGDIDEYTPIYSSKYTAKVDGYIFVYSVDNRESFDFIRKLHGRLYDLSHRWIPAILVANKSDLKNVREVTTAEGEKLAKLFGTPFFEISAKRHSSSVMRKVFETMVREIIKNEDQLHHLKILKNWEESKIQQLYTLFRFASVFNLIIGIFFITFGISFLCLYCEYIRNQRVVPLLLTLNGFSSMALSIIGYIGIQKEEQELIKINEVLLVISILLNSACFVLGLVAPIELPDKSHDKFAIQSWTFEELYFLLRLVMVVHILILIFLFFVSWVSKEIFVKRRNMPSNRFAPLKV